ncbi:A-kinase anchor protein 10, mitochondrial-like [Gigantopelta aegis]|uniref:A-kinase anchor protein 10, mitochondrial-like n=1 Tax=Gigantopelta aegis TaxID=1735272 RepID=UPI001B88DECC|nr:A-kinase anchor protein 10, mitochondrial-like [Gigantopelta aegis]
MSFFRRKLKAEVPEALAVSQVGLKRTPSNRSNASPKTPGSADSFFNGDIGVPDALLTSRPTQLLLSNTDNPSSFNGQLNSPMRTSSRLSKTLQEILHDRNAVTCFLEFLESLKAGHLLKFWLDAESFHASSVLRMRSRAIKGKSSSVAKMSQTDSPTTEISNSCAVQESQDAIKSRNENDSGFPKDKDSLTAKFEKEKHCTLSNQSSANPGDVHRNRTSSSNSLDNSSPALVTNLSDEHKGRTSSSGSLENSNQHKERGPTDSESVTNNTEPTAKKKVRPHLSEEELQQKLRENVQRDAVTVFTKYISPDATHPINVTEKLRNITISRICKEDGEVDPSSFADCQQFVVEKMNTEYYRGFLDSVFHCKHQVDVLTGGKVYLADFLYSEFALSYFMEFMEQEGGSQLLQFWLAADNFQQHLTTQRGSYDGIQAQNDAMILYDKYFSLQATEPLGFDDKTRFEVEGNICREAGPLPDCFAKPRDIVLHTLDKVYFQNFIKSEMYYKFLSDLVTTVQVSHDMPLKPKHKREASDTSSQHSGSSGSLGTDSLGSKNAQQNKKLSKNTADDMRFDAILLNPDELWKRPDTGPMSLGEVNHLGQFISQLAPVPDQDKKKGRFFKKREAKRKEEEEMALKIAEMIINDVKTMTQTGDICAGRASSYLDSSPSANSGQTVPSSSHQPGASS